MESIPGPENKFTWQPFLYTYTFRCCLFLLSFCINFNLWIFRLAVQLFGSARSLPVASCIWCACVYFSWLHNITYFRFIYCHIHSAEGQSLIVIWERAATKRAQKSAWEMVYCEDTVRNNVSHKSISLHDDIIFFFVSVLFRVHLLNAFPGAKRMMGTKTSQTIATNKQYTKRFILFFLIPCHCYHTHVVAVWSNRATEDIEQIARGRKSAAEYWKIHGWTVRELVASIYSLFVMTY